MITSKGEIMSLDWNVTKVADASVWGPDNTMLPKAEAIIWATMFVQMGSITENNCGEFMRRLDLWQYNVGPLLSGVYLNWDDIKLMVGLKTNVITETDKSWNSYFKGVLYSRAQEEVYRNAKHTA